jgi:trichothecene 3-O-acetyltransferase
MAASDDRDTSVRPMDHGLRAISAKQDLTPLDMNMPRLYGTRWILCFSLESEVDHWQVFDELKSALAHTICEFPWICGQVGPEVADPTSGKVEVVDGDGGVHLKFNELTGTDAQFPSFEELKACSFPLSKLSSTDLSPIGVMPTEQYNPVFAAQANFINGGLLLTVCAHHSVCDATGFHTVLQTWAQMVTAVRHGSSPITVDQVVNERHRLMRGSAGGVVEDFPEYILAPTPRKTKNDVLSHQLAETPFKMPEMTAHIFRVTASALAALKHAASAYSSNDALNALFWRHVTLARIAAAGDGTGTISSDTETALMYAVNVRSKFSPPLPLNYTGNASVANVTKKMSIAELTSVHGLAAGATAIRASVNRSNTPDRLSKMIGLIASRSDPTDFKFAYNGFLGPDLSSTSWTDLTVYESEWGSLGRPQAFRVPGEGSDGAVMVLPRLPDDSLEVLVALETNVMHNLIADKEFGQWASQVA